LGQAAGGFLPKTFLKIYFKKYKTFFQELSGPMAETLRRLGETAGTGLDYSTLQKVLTV